MKNRLKNVLKHGKEPSKILELKGSLLLVGGRGRRVGLVANRGVGGAVAATNNREQQQQQERQQRGVTDNKLRCLGWPRASRPAWKPLQKSRQREGEGEREGRGMGARICQQQQQQVQHVWADVQQDTQRDTHAKAENQYDRRATLQTHTHTQHTQHSLTHIRNAAQLDSVHAHPLSPLSAVCLSFSLQPSTPI